MALPASKEIHAAFSVRDSSSRAGLVGYKEYQSIYLFYFDLLTRRQKGSCDVRIPLYVYPTDLGLNTTLDKTNKLIRPLISGTVRDVNGGQVVDMTIGDRQVTLPRNDDGVSVMADNKSRVVSNIIIEAYPYKDKLWDRGLIWISTTNEPEIKFGIEKNCKPWNIPQLINRHREIIPRAVAELQRILDYPQSAQTVS